MDDVINNVTQQIAKSAARYFDTCFINNFTDGAPPITRCDCGAETVGSAEHSPWCSLSIHNERS